MAHGNLLSCLSNGRIPDLGLLRNHFQPVMRLDSKARMGCAGVMIYRRPRIRISICQQAAS